MNIKVKWKSMRWSFIHNWIANCGATEHWTWPGGQFLDSVNGDWSFTSNSYWHRWKVDWTAMHCFVGEGTFWRRRQTFWCTSGPALSVISYWYRTQQPSSGAKMHQMCPILRLDTVTTLGATEHWNYRTCLREKLYFARIAFRKRHQRWPWR